MARSERLVGLGDQVGVAFVHDVRRARELLAEYFAGFLRNFDGGLEIILGHRGNTPRSVTKAPDARMSLPLYHSRGFFRTGSGSAPQIAARMPAMRTPSLMLMSALFATRPTRSRPTQIARTRIRPHANPEGSQPSRRP